MGEDSTKEATATEDPAETNQYNPESFKVKVDHFDGIHCLGDETLMNGAPNFRQVTGFPIFGCAQPTEDGFMKVLEKVPRGSNEKVVRTVWYNMRQEPVIYCDGVPCAPRHPDRMHENLFLDESLADIEKLQKDFANVVLNLAKTDSENLLEMNKDSQYAENPLERENIVEKTSVNSVKTLQEVYTKVKENVQHLEMIRVPVVEDNAPKEACFDVLVDSLKQEPASTQCVFSCQAGMGRTTLGMIIACQVKEIQICTELRKMAELGIGITKDTAEDLIKQKFEFPLSKTDEEDHLLRGEFDVIKELLVKLPGAKEAKTKIDRIIDMCGPGPKGTGMQNLRESIIQTKWKYDVAPEDKQVAWRQMILNFMERYFYLICFATYAREYGPDGFQMSFVSWMDSHGELRKMIKNGKDKIEWYRQVDPGMLRVLQDMMKPKNYMENLSNIVRTIYEFAFITYADLPRGPIKNNSMRKLAAKTLMEILPVEVSSKVQARLEEQAANPDFVTLIGLVSFYAQ